jgi:hypothetical protein
MKSIVFPVETDDSSSSVSFSKNMKHAHPQFKKDLLSVLKLIQKNLSDGVDLTTDPRKQAEANYLQYKMKRLNSHLRIWKGSLSPSQKFRDIMYGLEKELADRNQLVNEARASMYKDQYEDRISTV